MRNAIFRSSASAYGELSLFQFAFAATTSTITIGAMVRTLRRLKRQGEHQQEIQKVLETPRAFRILCDRTDELAEQEKVTALLKALDPAAKDRPILKWLWEHREEILKIVLAIISMFGLRDE